MPVVCKNSRRACDLGFYSRHPCSVELEGGEIWFNAWRHLSRAETTDRLGPIDGEILSELLDRAGWAWNEAYRQGPVLVPD